MQFESSSTIIKKNGYLYENENEIWKRDPAPVINSKPQNASVVTDSTLPVHYVYDAYYDAFMALAIKKLITLEFKWAFSESRKAVQ